LEACLGRFWGIVKDFCQDNQVFGTGRGHQYTQGFFINAFSTVNQLSKVRDLAAVPLQGCLNVFDLPAGKLALGLIQPLFCIIQVKHGSRFRMSGEIELKTLDSSIHTIQQVSRTGGISREDRPSRKQSQQHQYNRRNGSGS
jgi:hypothetical protein